MPDQIHVYGYLQTQLSNGVPSLTVRQRAIARYGEDATDGIDRLIAAYFASVAAGAKQMQLGEDGQLDETDIPVVPGVGDLTVYYIKAYHNPGEYIWIINKIKQISVSLKDLILWAVAALREWMAKGNDTPTFNKPQKLEGQDIVAYRGGAANVPPGTFYISIERVQRETGNVNFF